jgi:hypothetical protein
MSVKIEQYVPVVQANGLNTNKAVSFGSTLAVAGATTFTTAPTGPTLRPTSSSAAAGATVVLTAADSGKVLINKSTSGTPSWTLPAVSDGLNFTFVCGNTFAGFTVTGGVVHLKTSASGTVLTSTTTVTNTQATAIVGDFISIVSDGTAWWTTSQSGIFAAS